MIERERPVEESEAIEREVVEAVEATSDGGPKPEDLKEAAEAAADGGRVTEDGGEVAVRSSEEISATPITLPKEDPDGIKAGSDQVSATPITLPKEDPDGIKAGTDQVSATPITLPKEDPDGIKTGADEIAATPITLPGPALENPDLVQPDAPSPEWEEDPPRPPQGTMEDVGPKTEIRDQAALSPDDVKLDDSSLDTGDREQTPTRPIMEKELPEGGQLQEGLDQREDLQDMMDKDLDSLIPGGGEIIGADGKKVGGSKLGDGVRGLPGMDSPGKIDGSSEDPSGDQFPGKGMFKPGKGPGGGRDAEAGYTGPTPTTVDEVEVLEMLAGNPSKKEVAAKEKQLQEKAMDDYEMQKSVLDNTPPPPPTPKKGKKKSSPDGEEGGSDVKAVSKEEFDAVIDKVDGGQISTQDPDGQSGEVPDRLTPEGAKKVKDALDRAASTKHKQKKAGAELITDPDQEDPEGRDIGKKENL